MLKERSQSFKLLFVFIDLFLSWTSFAIAFFLRYWLDENPNYFLNTLDIKSYILLGIFIGITQILAFISIDLYHPRRGLSLLDEFLAVISGVFLNLIFILAVLFFVRGESFSRLIISMFAIVCPIAISVSHFFIRKILESLRKKGYNLRKVIILGTGKNALSFYETISRHTMYGYVVNGFITGKKVAQKKGKDYKILGAWKDFEKILNQEKPDIVVYAFNHNEGGNLRDAIDICDSYGIDIKVIPSYEEFITARGRVDIIDGIPVISIRNIPIRLGYNQFKKRMFDIVFSLLFIILFSPFYIVIAILIKLTSKGPVFIKQERVGLDNKPFYMYKFRTMYVQDQKDSDTIWTKPNDPRVTKIGAFLRKTSLDETPQFFNVLMGSMSVVGPRPERPYFVEKFRSTHQHYMRRHAVKAGITGWAQIQGWRGDTSIEKRIEADIYYIENWSLLFDIKIILLTPLKGIFHKNAY